MDIFDFDGSAQHDKLTAAEDINRYLEESSADSTTPATDETASVDPADEEDSPALEDEENRHWGFIMDWGPF